MTYFSLGFVVGALIAVLIFVRLDKTVERAERRIMSELDDLKANVADLTTAQTNLSTSIATEITTLQSVEAQLTALQNQQTINPADVEAAAQSVAAVSANLKAAKAALDASVAPPAPPAPAQAA